MIHIIITTILAASGILALFLMYEAVKENKQINEQRKNQKNG